jgi:hypothetical protein
MLDRQNRPFLLLLAVLSAGCGDDGGRVEDAGFDASNGDSPPDPDGAADASRDADGGDADQSDADQDAEVEEAGTVLTNVSFDTAKPIELGPTGVLHPVRSAAQLDYFSFEAQAGEVYVITAVRGRFSPNNVISFYDSQREKVAENDVGWLWPGDLVDARLVVRARESGAHFVVLEDRELTDEVFAIEGIPEFFYRVTVMQVGPSTPGFVWESGDGDEPTVVAFTTDAASGVAYATVIGELGGDEIDRFELHGADAQVLVGHVHPGGVTGNGSSLIDGVIGVHDTSEQLVAEIDRARGVQFIHPPLQDADYTLSVRSDGSLGDNAFYAIDLVLLNDNPSESATDNDTPETAQSIELLGGFLRRGTILAELPALDRDYFAFQTMPGDVVDVICEGESAGSGVRGLKAEILDPQDAVLGDATETLAAGLVLSKVQTAEPGTHYLRLSSETPDGAEAAPAWVRCAVIAEP